MPSDRPSDTLNARRLRLSDDARAIAGSQFGGSDDIELVIVPATRTTARAKAALDELVAAGILKSGPTDDGGVCYHALVDCSDYLSWLARNRNKGHFKLALSTVNVIRRRRNAAAA